MSDYKYPIKIAVDALMDDDGNVLIEECERSVDLEQITFVKEWCTDEDVYLLDEGDVVTTCAVARQILKEKS